MVGARAASDDGAVGRDADGSHAAADRLGQPSFAVEPEAVVGIGFVDVGCQSRGHDAVGHRPIGGASRRWPHVVPTLMSSQYQLWDITRVCSYFLMSGLTFASSEIVAKYEGDYWQKYGTDRGRSVLCRDLNFVPTKDKGIPKHIEKQDYNHG